MLHLEIHILLLRQTTICLLAWTGARPGADDLPDIYCLTCTLARLELTHASAHGPYSCLYCLRTVLLLPPPHPSAPGSPPLPWTTRRAGPLATPAVLSLPILLPMDRRASLRCGATFLDLDHHRPFLCPPVVVSVTRRPRSRV
ncbi:hypothetical protein K438DRAFT_929567 [Mycena galopus ATCC 62051]|nr:hypothetical protein K438DRAFT_929567 [Mycena galopus ATCC 62051]